MVMMMTMASWPAACSSSSSTTTHQHQHPHRPRLPSSSSFCRPHPAAAGAVVVVKEAANNGHARRGRPCCALPDPQAAAALLVAAGTVGVAATLLLRNSSSSSEQQQQQEAADEKEEEDEAECPECGGTGLCGRCKGEGFVFKQLSEDTATKARKAAKNMATRYTAGLPTKWTYCNKCSSTRSCTACRGSGRIIKVKAPATPASSSNFT